MSAEFITTIWRDNDASNIATNDATNGATPKDYLANNKRIIDRKVAKKVSKRMTEQQLKECIIEACYVEHSVEELAKLLKNQSRIYGTDSSPIWLLTEFFCEQSWNILLDKRT